jgi:hypothetical protein
VETTTAANPFQRTYSRMGELSQNALINQIMLGDQCPVSEDTGATTWTSGSATKRYSLYVNISDDGTAPPFIAEHDDLGAIVPIYAQGDEKVSGLVIDSVTGRGGGGGISVY